LCSCKLRFLAPQQNSTSAGGAFLHRRKIVQAPKQDRQKPQLALAPFKAQHKQAQAPEGAQPLCGIILHHCKFAPFLKPR
jgi:hypothetical protein